MLGKFKKKCRFYPKNNKIPDIKNLKHSIDTRNYAAPYYQTLKEIPWPLNLEKLSKNDQNFQKN